MLNKQLVVVPADRLYPYRQSEPVSLFNEDGSPLDLSQTSGLSTVIYDGSEWTVPSFEHPWLWVIESGDPTPTSDDGLMPNDVVVYTDPSEEARRVAAISGRDQTLLWTPPLIETVSMDALNAQIASTSGLLFLNYRSAPVADFVASRFAIAQGNVAGSGITFAAMGLWTVEDNGDLTLVARSDNATTMFANASTIPRANFSVADGFSDEYAFDLGERFVVGVLVVGTTMPNFRSQNNAGAAVLAEGGIYRASAQVSGLSNLPETIAVGDLVASALRPWMAVEAA